MKVLHVFKVYLPEARGGIEQVIWQVAEGTFPLGVESTVFTLSKRPARNALSVDHHHVVQAKEHFYIASTGLTLTGMGTFRRLAAEADVIHYHFPWPMMDFMHVLAGLSKPSIVTYHSDVVKQSAIMPVYRPLMDNFLGRVDAIVATSPNYAASSAVLTRYRDKVQVIPIGLDPARSPTPSEGTLEKWRARVGEGFFLFLGALRYYKGLQYLLEAAEQTGLPVVIAGHGELDVGIDANNVSVLGAVSEDDKSALLHLAGGFVFPSHLRSEAFGVALLEAAFAGLPMISCEIGTGTSYVNSHGETGLVVPPGDSAGLASAMMTLWQDEDLRAQFGAAARARAQRMFRADDAARAYVTLYEEVVARSRHG